MPHTEDVTLSQAPPTEAYRSGDGGRCLKHFDAVYVFIYVKYLGSTELGTSDFAAVAATSKRDLKVK